jgi:hypothetical protein
MHREVQELRAARKTLFHTSDPMNEGQQCQLQDLLLSLDKLLLRGPLPAFQNPQMKTTLESFMNETAALVKQRL